MIDADVIGAIFSLFLAGGIAAIGFGIYTLFSVSIGIAKDREEFEAKRSKQATPAQIGG